MKEERRGEEKREGKHERCVVLCGQRASNEYYMSEGISDPILYKGISYNTLKSIRSIKHRRRLGRAR